MKKLDNKHIHLLLDLIMARMMIFMVQHIIHKHMEVHIHKLLDQRMIMLTDLIIQDINHIDIQDMDILDTQGIMVQVDMVVQLIKCMNEILIISKMKE